MASGAGNWGLDCTEGGMRVLVIIPDAGRYGGTSRFLERLLDIHARRGIITTLLVPTDQCHCDINSLAARYGAKLVRSPNRTVQDTPPFLTPFFDFLFSWRTVLTHRPDLIVVSTGDPGRLSVSFYFPVPVLYILHTIPEHNFRTLPRWYLRIGSMFNNCVMTVSNAAAESISKSMGIPRNRIEVVYNSAGIAVRSNELNTPVVLTAGHMVAYKNPELWLDAARTVVKVRPGSTFVWLGDGELLETIRDKVRQMSLEDRILLPGYTPYPSTWYDQACIYFQPSLRENHSIAVLEAMGYGLPCVVSDIGGLPESVLDGENGYVVPSDDVDSFVTLIIKILDDQQLREKMGASGRLRIQEFFTEEIQEHRILELYQRLTKVAIV